MAGVRGDVLSDLPDDLRALLAAPPITEKKLLEVSIAWADLPSGQARMAEALRLFVITWDPLEHAGPRSDAFATVNAGPAGPRAGGLRAVLVICPAGRRRVRHGCRGARRAGRLVRRDCRAA
jgi:hypothetical protein